MLPSTAHEAILVWVQFDYARRGGRAGGIEARVWSVDDAAVAGNGQAFPIASGRVLLSVHLYFVEIITLGKGYGGSPTGNTLTSRTVGHFVKVDIINLSYQLLELVIRL